MWRQTMNHGGLSMSNDRYFMRAHEGFRCIPRIWWNGAIDYGLRRELVWSSIGGAHSLTKTMRRKGLAGYNRFFGLLLLHRRRHRIGAACCVREADSDHEISWRDISNFNLTSTLHPLCVITGPRHLHDRSTATRSRGYCENDHYGPPEGASLDTNVPMSNFQHQSLSSAHPGQSALASGAAALFTSSLLHPLDLIKTRMQVAAVTNGAIPAYSSTARAVGVIWQQEGCRGLWKGVGSSAVASVASWSLFRYVFEKLRFVLPELRLIGWNEGWGFPRNVTGSSSARLTMTAGSSVGSDVSEGSADNTQWKNNLWAGLFAGAIVTCLTHPLWLVKARLEMQAAESKGAGWPHYRGGVDCFIRMASNGVGTLFRGIGPAFWLVPHAAIQMVVYEEFKARRGKAQCGGASDFLPFIWGAISKFVAITSTYPLQVLRSRQQVVNSPYENLNFVRIASVMMRQEGIKAFFGGYWVHVYRACLQNGTMFLIFEGVLDKMIRS